MEMDDLKELMIFNGLIKLKVNHLLSDIYLWGKGL